MPIERWCSISASAKAMTRSARCCRACSACRLHPTRGKARAAEGWSLRDRRRAAQVFLHDLLDLPQTGEWPALYDAMDNASRTRGKRTVAGSACRNGPT